MRVHEPFSALDFIQPDPNHSWSLPQAIARVQAAPSGVIILLHRTEDAPPCWNAPCPKTANWCKMGQKTYGNRRANARQLKREKNARAGQAIGDERA